MPTITVTANYDGYVYLDFLGGYFKDAVGTEVLVGGDAFFKDRGFFRFPLDALPSDATVTQVRRRVYCATAGGTAHLTDTHAYGTNGQENPEPEHGSSFLLLGF